MRFNLISLLFQIQPKTVNDGVASLNIHIVLGFTFSLCFQLTCHETIISKKAILIIIAFSNVLHAHFRSIQKKNVFSYY